MEKLFEVDKKQFNFCIWITRRRLLFLPLYFENTLKKKNTDVVIFFGLLKIYIHIYKKKKERKTKGQFFSKY